MVLPSRAVSRKPMSQPHGMKNGKVISRSLNYFGSSHVFLILLTLALSSLSTLGQTRRLVVIKCDGLPPGLIDRFVKEKDPATGKSRLPWFDYIFYQRGTRLSNFYVRGMSLSAPSWSMLDTGQ